MVAGIVYAIMWRNGVADPRFPLFGAVAGVTGCLAAVVAIKLICGIGELLADRLLVGDLGEMQFRVFRTRRRPDCPVCGTP